MFWRKSRAAIEQFHPMHQMIVWQRVLYTTQDRDGWARLAASLMQHNTVVRRPKWALPPRTLDVLVPLVQILCQDLGPNGTLAVTADLRGSRMPEKSGPQRQLPVRPPARSATEWMVVDPWLRLRVTLRDRSVLEVTVTDRLRHRLVRKVSRSGKRKTKEKVKEVQLIRVTRTLPRGVLGSRPAQPPPRWIRVKLRTGRRQVLVAVARLNRVPGGAEQVHHLLTVLAEPFRWTRPVARPSRGVA